MLNEQTIATLNALKIFGMARGFEERLVGKLTLENEFLKKGLQNSLSQSPRNGKSSVNGSTSSAASGGGAVS